MKLKSLAAAALVAASAPSFAEVITNYASYDLNDIGKAEYVFIATNASGSYFQDLGISTSALDQLLSTLGSFSQAVSGAEWSKFVAFGGSGTKWSIVAAQPIGDGLNAGEINGWTTVAAGQTLGTVQNAQSNQGILNFNDIFKLNDALSNPKVADNRLAVAVGKPGFIDAEVKFSGYFDTRNDIGTSAQMVYLTPSSDLGDDPAAYLPLKNSSNSLYTANFDGTNVTITATVIPVTAPVPEPSTYAMLIGGLAAVGFVARRRKSA